ncbi:MAG: glycine--tRNA ligase subunit alpha, partial [Hyphomicrobium sp.]
DARRVISVTERQSYILRVREMAKKCCAAWLKTEGGGA